MSRKTKNSQKAALVVLHVFLGVMTGGLWWVGLLIWHFMSN